MSLAQSCHGKIAYACDRLISGCNVIMIIYILVGKDVYIGEYYIHYSYFDYSLTKSIKHDNGCYIVIMIAI